MSRAIFGSGGGGREVNGGADFIPWPVTEAKADSDFFITEFDNETAGANETGVGWDETGANLVLTQNGSVPGAVNNARTITLGAAQGFSTTSAMVNRLWQSPNGFGILMHLRDLVTPTGRLTSVSTDTYELASLMGAIESVNKLALSVFYTKVKNPSGFDYHAFYENFTIDAGDKVTVDTYQLEYSSEGYYPVPANSDFWFAASFDPATNDMWNGLAIGEDQPLKMSDFVHIRRLNAPAVDRTGTMIIDDAHIIGSGTKSLGLSVVSLTMGLKPFGS